MQPALYFWGSELGTVGPMEAKDFGSFVAHLKANITRIKMTRAEFLSQPQEKRGQIKRTNFFTPCAFVGEGRRCRERATVCNLIAIDIDDSRDAGPLVSQKGVLARRLAGLAFTAYLTANSTDAAPRMRVVIAANAIASGNYYAAVHYVAGLLQLRTVTPESLTPVQPMFFPTIFQGEELL